VEKYRITNLKTTAKQRFENHLQKLSFKRKKTIYTNLLVCAPPRISECQLNGKLTDLTPMAIKECKFKIVKI